MVGHVQQAVLALGADRVTGLDPGTLAGNCGPNPGLACRLVWDVSHDGRAASLTNEFLAGPVHLVLRVAFVIVLAVVIQAIVHRVINRLTERATQSLLSQLHTAAASAAASRLGGARVVRAARIARDARTRRRARAVMTADESVAGTGDESTLVNGAADEAPAEVAGGEPAGAADASQGEIDGAAARAERALVDERRKQRVRALGAILRSASSVTIFSIAGVVILGDLGINLAPLLASAGVVGIAIGFGAQNMVRDYLAGIFMLVEDQYGVGDVITVGDATGTVENVTLRVTRMRDVNGIVWHIRNGTIDTVGNESQGWARAVIDFPVPYATDLGTIRSLLAETAENMWNEPLWRAVMLEPPEVWGAQEVSSDEIIMRIVVKTAPLRQWEVEREMRHRLKTALDAAGIPPAANAD